MEECGAMNAAGSASCKKCWAYNPDFKTFEPDANVPKADPKKTYT